MVSIFKHTIWSKCIKSPFIPKCNGEITNSFNHPTITSLIRFTLLHYPELPLKEPLSWRKKPSLKSATTTLHSFFNIIKNQQILTYAVVIITIHGRILLQSTLHLIGKKSEKKLLTH